MTFRDAQAVPLFPTVVWSHDLAQEVHEQVKRRLLAEQLAVPKWKGMASGNDGG